MHGNSKVLLETVGRRVIRDIALGLKDLHSCGIVHRDIKPLNILLDQNGQKGRSVIADLGVSFKLNGQDDESRWIIGTDGFIAPEVRFGEPYRTPCDIFSLGCILHWLLTGMCPFWHHDIKLRSKALLEKELNFDKKKFSGVSDAFKDLLTVMLEKNPEKRATVDDVLNHQWLAYDSHQIN